MKKNIFFVTVLSTLWFAGPVFSSGPYQRTFGAGVILGEPTGLSFKNWLNRTAAVDAAVAWSFGREDSLHIHLDYLVHDFKLFKTKRGKLPLIYGIGARLKLEDRTRFGIRIPVGISYIFEKTPVDLFFELGPVVDLIPRTDVTISASLGMRYYF